MKNIRIKIEGRVQGVFFRGSTKKTADKLNLKGFVKNKYDGSVLIEVQGKEDKLNEFIKFCKTGPVHAYVENIEIKEIELKNYNFFDIKY